MNRRSLFKSLVACVAASAMEVYGWKPETYAGFDPSFSLGGDRTIKSDTIIFYDSGLAHAWETRLVQLQDNLERNIIDICGERDQRDYRKA